jgi:hypothetical protein
MIFVIIYYLIFGELEIDVVYNYPFDVKLT